MTFWAYMLQCADRHFYTGHTDDLEVRIGQHRAGSVAGYTSTRLPVELVWSQEFPTRYEALAAERQIKGWSRAKKLALIRGDWDLISTLARSGEKVRASTSSARTEWGLRRPLALHKQAALRRPIGLSLTALADFADGRFQFDFRLLGSIANLRLPTLTSARRSDSLWQHTCFEAFVGLADGAYLEFNFSPSTAWAAYRFASYREGMIDLMIDPPAVRVKQTSHLLELKADVEIPAMPLRIGLSAVIEEADGTKSYWALRHPPGDRPDFHHPDCFAIELPAPTAP